MQARCLTSFFTEKKSGVPGQMIQIDSQQQMDDLVQAGYVEEVQGKSQTTSQETTAISQDMEKKATTKKKADDLK